MNVWNHLLPVLFIALGQYTVRSKHGGGGNGISCPLSSLSTVLSFLWTLCADLPLWAGLDTVHRAAMAGAEVGPVGTSACWSMSISTETQENHSPPVCGPWKECEYDFVNIYCVQYVQITCGHHKTIYGNSIMVFKIIVQQSFSLGLDLIFCMGNHTVNVLK